MVKEFESNSGLILNSYGNDKSGIFITCYTADKHFLHFSILLYYCSFILIQAGAYNELYAVFLCHFNGPVVKHARTERSQFEHLIVSDLVKLVRCGNDPGICGVYTVNIGVDLTVICMKSSGQCYGGGIGASASQCGLVIILGDSLETGDDHDLVLLQLVADTLAVDTLKTGISVYGCGVHGYLECVQ